MKIYTITIEIFSNVILTGTILLTKYDYAGMASYILKAFIVAAIWTAFKFFGDYLSHKFLKKNKNDDKDSSANPSEE